MRLLYVCLLFFLCEAFFFLFLGPRPEKRTGAYNRQILKMKGVLCILVALLVLAEACHAFHSLLFLHVASRNRKALSPVLRSPKNGVLTLTSQMVTKDILREV